MCGRLKRHAECMAVEPQRGTIRQRRMDKAPITLRLLGACSLLLLFTSCGNPSIAHGPASSATSSSTVIGSANASCVGPYLNDQPPGGPFRGPEQIVSPGTTITIYGHWYTSTCNDTGDQDPLEALPPVHLILTLPGGSPQSLGQFLPSGQDMGFSVEVHVPAETQEGSATIRDDRPFATAYTFEVGQ